MKNKMMGLLALLAALGLSACVDQTSPGGVVASAYTSLKAQNVKEFKEVLMGEAQERYGNLAGMGELERAFTGYDVFAGKTELTQAEQNPYTGRDSRRVYSVEIRGRELDGVKDDAKLLYIAKVFCEVRWERREPPRNGMGYRDWYGGLDPFWQDYMTCWISELN